MNQPSEECCGKCLKLINDCYNPACPCHQPIEEKWKEEFDEKFVRTLRIPAGYSSLDHTAVLEGSIEEVKSFIENLLEQERKRMSDEIAVMKTYTGGSSVNEKDKRVNKQQVLSIINK